MSSPAPRVLVLSTLGHASKEENRVRDLCGRFDPQVFPFDRRHKLRMAGRLWRTVRRTRPDVIVVEGTGSAVGLTLMLLRLVGGYRYVVSSGDVTFGAELSFSIPGAPVAFAPLPAPHLELIQFPGLLVLNWSEPGVTLESAAAVSGPWTVVSTTPPFLIATTNSATFYRLRR